MMMLARWAFVFLLALAGGWSCFLQETGARARGADPSSRIAGIWRGHSACVDKNSACHDEVNVYRFSTVAGRPNTFSVTASKVVDGKEVVMGTGDWKWDAEKKVVECEAPAVRLAVDGNKMEGALSLPYGTVYRRIYLEREN